MTAPDPQQWQRPAAHGYSPNPPNNDWGQPPVVSGPTWPQQVAQTQAEPPPPPPKRSVLPWVVAGLAVLAAAGAWAYASLGGESGPAAAVSNLVAPSEAPPFERAQGQCDVLKLGTSIKDGGKTLIVDVRGKESITGMSVDELECVFNALEMPESVRAQIWDTRALDGRQSATWDGFSASWTYHPDDGLDAIITATS